MSAEQPPIEDVVGRVRNSDPHMLQVLGEHLMMAKRGGVFEDGARRTLAAFLGIDITDREPPPPK